MAARFSLLKGYSRDRDANATVSLFWGCVTEAGSAPWFEHVPSKAQLADAVSRQDWVLAKSENWLRIEPDFDGLWDIVADISAHHPVATPQHIQRVRRWAREQRERHPPMTVGRVSRRARSP